MKTPELVLASSSPRRREILAAAGYAFRVVPSGAEEKEKGLSPVELVIANALAKARSVASRADCADAVVLGADTVVLLSGVILGKPADAADAKRMISSLSGTEHEVLTGFAVLYDGSEQSGVCRTRVRFRALSEDEIDAYIATGEPFDKAGAYGIQERGSILVEHVEGDFFNVVGLPIAQVYPALKANGVLPFAR